MSHQDLPQRIKLPHEVPAWVDQGARHFFTINCRDRGVDSLVAEGRAARLLESVTHYEKIGRWYVWLFLVMPDHLHGIVSFNLARGIQQAVSSWKGYGAKKYGIHWQSGFFEHRLRSREEYDEKAAYIRMNPVRQGLVKEAGQWPWLIDRAGLEGRANPPGEPKTGLAGGLALPGDG